MGTKKKSGKRTKGSGRAQARSASRMRASRASRLTVAELMALAAQPVPEGSGHEELGRGPHVYMKGNLDDGSTRALCFQRRADAMRAQELSMQAELGALAELLGDVA